MKQNLCACAAQNLVAVPLAPVGFVLPMEVGPLLMSLPSVVVASNAQLLRRLDLRPEASVAACRRGTQAGVGRVLLASLRKGV